MINRARLATPSVCRVRQAVLRSEQPENVSSRLGAVGRLEEAAHAAGLSVLSVGTSHFQDKIPI